MIHYEEALQDTIRRGRRRQDPLIPQKYWYSLRHAGLSYDNVLVVAIVLFGDEEVGSEHWPNNHVATAFQKHVR